MSSGFIYQISITFRLEYPSIPLCSCDLVKFHIRPHLTLHPCFMFWNSLRILNLETHMRRTSFDPLSLSVLLMCPGSATPQTSSFVVTSEQKEHLLFSCSGMCLLIVACQLTLVSALQGFHTSSA